MLLFAEDRRQVEGLVADDRLGKGVLGLYER